MITKNPPSSTSPPNPYPSNKPHTLPARSGAAVPLSPNQTLRVINTHGTQVVDTWAFAAADFAHHMSMSHTRARNNRLSPLVGDLLYTNHRVPMLQLVQDTSPGVHDTVIAACDIWRYRELVGLDMQGGGDGEVDAYYHESCAENLVEALKRDVAVDVCAPGWKGWGNGPDPLNLFMNIPIHPNAPAAGVGSATTEEKKKILAEVSPSAGADLSFERPVSKPGQYVRLRNVSGGEVVVVMSACPQDLLDINCGVPRSVEFVVEEAE